MARIRLLPGINDQAMYENFQRIENISEAVADTDSGRLVVTGSIIVNTRLSRVDSVVASFANAPIANACFIAAYPAILTGGAPNQVAIFVYSNAFAASITSISISWMASGELILG